MELLNVGVKTTNYYYSPLDGFLETDNYKLQGSNIGYEGENLTISFLSLNRIELSKRLLSSIANHLANFKGEVLIVDNGSNKDELEQLKNYCLSLPYRYRIVELRDNYGVAGGRNRTMEFVETEWVLCLDNDIFFINNPLKKISEDISLLGCHFFNLPLLDSDSSKIFALGGHLYVESYLGNINVGGGSCFKQTDSAQLSNTDKQPFLSNFLFGGACVFKKDTFLKLTGYDDNMFIGFEDIDFSIRLFREGFKIGNTQALSLVHDHPQPKDSADVDYEKKRFSASIIKDSALYLENKYGFKIWDQNLITWLEEKNRYIGNEININREEKMDINKKPKIALITDVDYWAFGNIARQIEKNLNPYFDFSLVSLEECGWNPNKLLFKTSDCDILHFFWRECIPLINSENYDSYFGNIPVSFDDFVSENLNNKVLSTCVYDHLFLKQEEIEKRKGLFNKFNYYVCSKKLESIYNKIDGYPKPKMVIEDGVDPDLFYPINRERLKDKGKTLTIGWVGNSKWAGEVEDFKGFHTIVKPAIQELKKSGYNIEGFYCDRNDKLVPHEEMVNYYANIDILVCMSKIEGTPNPVLEAMACGIPIISTDVGIVPQVFGEKQKKYILLERSIESLQSAILEMYTNRHVLWGLSEENLLNVKEWYWEKQCNKFKSYFEQLIQK